MHVGAHVYRRAHSITLMCACGCMHVGACLSPCWHVCVEVCTLHSPCVCMYVSVCVAWHPGSGQLGAEQEGAGCKMPAVPGSLGTVRAHCAPGASLSRD